MKSSGLWLNKPQVGDLTLSLPFCFSPSWLTGRYPEFTDPKVVAQGEGREGGCLECSVLMSGMFGRAKMPLSPERRMYAQTAKSEHAYGWGCSYLSGEASCQKFRMGKKQWMSWGRWPEISCRIPSVGENAMLLCSMPAYGAAPLATEPQTRGVLGLTPFASNVLLCKSPAKSPLAPLQWPESAHKALSLFPSMWWPRTWRSWAMTSARQPSPAPH